MPTIRRVSEEEALVLSEAGVKVWLRLDPICLTDPVPPVIVERFVVVDDG